MLWMRTIPAFSTNQIEVSPTENQKMIVIISTILVWTVITLISTTIMNKWLRVILVILQVTRHLTDICRESTLWQQELFENVITNVNVYRLSLPIIQVTLGYATLLK